MFEEFGPGFLHADELRHWGYNTDAFNPADPRNVAPGSNSVDVVGKLSTWEQIQDAIRKNKTAIYWAAAGLVGLAVLKGRR